MSADNSDIISEVATGLSNLAPYASVAETFAELGIDIIDYLKGKQEDYDQEYQDSLKQAANLVTEDCDQQSPGSAAALGAFDDELLADNGRPLVGGISNGPYLRVRADRLLAHIADSLELRFRKQLDAELRKDAEQSGAEQVTAPAPTSTKSKKSSS